MGRSSKTVLTLTGFDELINKIERAGGSVRNSVNAVMNESATIMKNELTAQMQKANVDSGLISRMPAPKVEWQGNKCTAQIGYEKGTFNSNNLSDGYKVVFLNYGTPKDRHTNQGGQKVFIYGHWATLGNGRGAIKARGFINKAKKKAKPQIKKKQEETLHDILKGLE